MSPDAKIRNIAAITLMDSGNTDAVEARVTAIGVVAYREARGTLIYALSGFDGSSRFSQIFRWAVEGGFEALHEAMSILRDQGITPTELERAECLALLREAQVQWDSDLLDELFTYLE